MPMLLIRRVRTTDSLSQNLSSQQAYTARHRRIPFTFRDLTFALLYMLCLGSDRIMRRPLVAAFSTGGYLQRCRYRRPISKVDNHDFLNPSHHKLRSRITRWMATAPTNTDSERQLRTCCDRLFDLELPEGRCVGLQLQDIAEDSPNALTLTAIANDSHWIHNLLHPDEVAYGLKLPSESTRESFYLGRLAIREALRPRDVKSIAILKDEYGRPNVPPGFLGSISHKRSVGVALVALDLPKEEHLEGPLLGIGIDIEHCSPSGRRSVAKKVLMDKELDELGRIEGLAKEEEVLLRFSIKESLYKAMHPLICQYVGFQEASTCPKPDGTVIVDLNLQSGAHECFGEVKAHWRRVGDFFLTSASVRLKNPRSEPCEM